ncbi:MAG: WG repeat-containing protein [Bacillota bacterium]
MKRKLFATILATLAICSGAVCTEAPLGFGINEVYAQTTTTMFGANVIPLEVAYEAEWEFSEGLMAVAHYDTPTSGFLNMKGEEVFPFIYPYGGVYNFLEGMAGVKNAEGLIGFIDETGKEVIPCIYTGIAYWGFAEDVVGVWNAEGKAGFIDKTGKEVIPFIYDGVSYFSEGLAVASDDAVLWGYIDKTGAEVIPNLYENAGVFSEGLAVVVKDGMTGYIDQTGAEVIPFEYEFGGDFSEGLAMVVKDNRAGFIDATGAEVIPCIYENARSFSEGLVAVSKDNETWGYIDQTGAEVTPFIYKDAMNFSEGLAYVTLGDTIQFIDKTGAVVIDFTGFTQPISGTKFVDGHIIARVVEDDTWVNYVVQNPLLHPVTTNPVLPPTATEEVETEVETEEVVEVETEVTEAVYKSAKSTTSLVTVNGQATDFDAYLIEGSNYFKLRDLAFAFNGTGKQFEVSWDGEQKAINLLPGQAYTVAGGEMAPASGLTKSASQSSSQLLLEGAPISLAAYVIEGNTYFKLRDICEQLDIEVTWDDATQVIGING